MIHFLEFTHSKTGNYTEKTIFIHLAEQMCNIQITANH